jgi:hypothetical protein
VWQVVPSGVAHMGGTIFDLGEKDMFKIGDEVVCICDDWTAMEGSDDVLPSNAPIELCIYVVLGMFRALSEDHRWLIKLNGIPDMGFDADAFRPVQKTSLDCFTHLLRPTPTKKKKFQPKKKASV